jgi:RNA polymerase sigma factor (sigma-70 family)
MNEVADFTQLLERAARNDGDAMRRVVSEYEDILRRAARHQLGQAMRRHVDSLDIVQSVYRSLLVGLRNGRFDIATPDKFVALAVLIIRRKVARKWRKLRKQPVNLAIGPSGAGWSAIAGPPDQAAGDVDAHELLDRVLAELDPLDAQLVQMRLAGHSTAEVARRLGVDSGLLRVRLGRLRKHLSDRGLLEEWL